MSNFNAQKLFKLILTSRVYEAAVETPLEENVELSEQLGNHVLLKREDLQPVFSFKLRGAYNRIAHLSHAERQQGVIAASAGNHAQGVAFSAKQLGIRAVIVMPKTTPSIKIDAVKHLGAEVILHGDNYSDAAAHCSEIVEKMGMIFVHPFDDELVIAGQGTVADEIMRQFTGKLDAVFVPIGGGGLIAGMAVYIKTLCPEVKIIGVEPVDSDAMNRSLVEGHRVILDSVGIFADGVAVKEVGQLTFDLCRDYVDEIVLVDTDELCSGIKTVFQATRSIVEPAGGLAVAGLKKYIRENNIYGQNLVAVTSGANMNFERLRYVSERTMVGEKQEGLFVIMIPEHPGALFRFCSEVVGEYNITEFNYRLSNRDCAHILVGVSFQGDTARADFSQALTSAGFDHSDLTDDDLAKTHIRYMIGGRYSDVSNERLYRFWFPERPGALTQFLVTMGERWNISLFHYRNQGADFGRVLIGLEVPPSDKIAFNSFLDQLGYHFREETDNSAYKLFL